VSLLDIVKLEKLMVLLVLVREKCNDLEIG